MRKSMLLPVILLWGGCVRPLEISEDEATAFVFANFDTADTAELARAVGERLLPFMEARLAAVEDPSNPTDPTWLTEIPNLTEADLGTLTLPDDVELETITWPVGRVRSSNFVVAANRAMAVVPQRACIESDTTTWATREFLTDEVCFVDGSCDELSVFQPTHKENSVTEIWYDQYWDHRVIDVDTPDGETVQAFLARSYLDQRWYNPSGGSWWDQIWVLDVVIDDGEGGSIGWYAYWTSLKVGIVPDSVIEGLARDGLHQGAEWGEYWLENNEPHPDCPHDRAAEAPERWENEPG